MRQTLLPETPVEVPDGGLTISQVSTATGVGISALRYYERENLMLSRTPRDGGGRRRYGRDDVDWIAGLVMLRETGMSISDLRSMAEISRRDGSEAERLRFLEAHHERVLAQLARTRRHLTAIEKKIRAYRAVTTEGEER